MKKLHIRTSRMQLMDIKTFTQLLLIGLFYTTIVQQCQSIIFNEENVIIGCDTTVNTEDAALTTEPDSLNTEADTIFINFTYVGQLSETDRITLDASFIRQLKALNKIFNPHGLRFEMYNKLIYYHPDINFDLSDVRDLYFGESQKLKLFFESIDIENVINIYSFPFNEKDGMTGYTATLTGAFQWYQEETPRWDRVFVSHYGMIHRNTMIHELTHYFHASKDIVYMSDEELKAIGINSREEACTNHMNYNCYTDHLTRSQIAYFVTNAYTIRSYLLD